MKPFWMKEVFRNAEGEGAGGADGTPSEGAQPAPDRVTALEQRMERMMGAVEGMTRETKSREAQTAVQKHQQSLDMALKDAETGVSQAEANLADAYDNGEGIEIAKAQRALTEAVAKRERADIAKGEFAAKLEAAKREEAQRQPQDATNLNDWKKKHAAWYGVDAAMTKAAHAADRQIRENNVHSVGSKEYFDAVDRIMMQQFPDKFGGTPPTAGAGDTPAPGGSRSRGRIQQSIAEGYRRMGIDIDDPKVVERMVKHRETAVSKGILPSEPVRGPVVTR